MGRGKGREPLPNNVSKMAPDFRGNLLVLGHIALNIYKMAEHAVVQEEELLSLSMQPFQDLSTSETNR